MPLNKTPNLDLAALAIAKLVDCTMSEAVKKVEEAIQFDNGKDSRSEERRESEATRMKSIYITGLTDSVLIDAGVLPSKLTELEPEVQEVIVQKITGSKSKIPKTAVSIPVPTEELETVVPTGKGKKTKKVGQSIRRREKAEAKPKGKRTRKPNRKKAITTITVQALLANVVKHAGSLKRFVSRNKLRHSPTHASTPAPKYFKTYFNSISGVLKALSRDFACIAVAFAQGDITKEQFHRYFVLIPVYPPKEIQFLLKDSYQWL